MDRVLEADIRQVSGVGPAGMDGSGQADDRRSERGCAFLIDSCKMPDWFHGEGG